MTKQELITRYSIIMKETQSQSPVELACSLILQALNLRSYLATYNFLHNKYLELWKSEREQSDDVQSAEYFRQARQMLGVMLQVLNSEAEVD